MPLRVLMKLPPGDGPWVTEETLAEQVLEEFIAVRNAGSHLGTMLCSVSSVRLQQAMFCRYPVAYQHLVVEGRWRGKWHCFVDEIVGLNCFLYTPKDYVEVIDLDVHIAPSELRCCLKGDDHRCVRQADGVVGALLREDVLQKDALHRWCNAVVKAGMAEAAAGVVGRALWQPPPPAPLATKLAKEICSFGGGCRRGSACGQLRRGAAKEIARLLTEEHSLARHMSVLRLRYHVTHCLKTWVPVTSDTPPAKKCFMAALG